MRRIRKYADTHAHSEVRLSSVFTGVKEGDTGVGGGGGGGHHVKNLRKNVRRIYF